MESLDISTLLACGYAVFLALLAAGFEFIARHSHHRTQRLRTVGFSYHSDLDLWKCPNDKYLYRAEVARESTAVIYRAAAHHCNSCPIKSRCTDSDEGRSIEVQPDSWLQSELRKFHRGLSLTLLLLADLILLATMVSRNNAADEILAALLLLCITVPGIRLASRFFRASNMAAAKERLTGDSS